MKTVTLNERQTKIVNNLLILGQEEVLVDYCDGDDVSDEDDVYLEEIQTILDML